LKYRVLGFVVEVGADGCWRPAARGVVGWMTDQVLTASLTVLSFMERATGTPISIPVERVYD